MGDVRGPTADSDVVHQETAASDSGELPVDKNEGDPACFARSVRPPVVGTPLYHHVAGADGCLAVIEQQRDLAVENDSVVDRLCPVK